MPIIGIDLGTTNSLAAVWKDGKCELIPNALGKFLTPSVVSIDDKGEILVGETAKERLISYPEYTATGFKRFMGKDTKIMLGKHTFTPIELSSFILRRLKEDAEIFLGEKVTEAVISVPAYFDDNGRNATKIAGELAGFKVERIINEPSAAALAYHKDHDMSFLVIDFGGGTLDVSVVDAFSNVIEIVAVSGDNHLGGDDFNNAIANYFCKQNNIKPDTLSKETIASLVRQAERCKVTLSKTEPVMMISEIDRKQCSALLTNQKLVEICAPLLRRMEKPIARALRDCKSTLGEVDEIVMVGGSCNMPLIRQYIEHILGKKPLFDIDSDKTVAIGTGIAAAIKERKSDIKDTLLTDICPFTLGVNVLNYEDPTNDLFSPIIERNTTLPTSRMRTYYTVHDNQSQMFIAIYQGESMYCKDNLKLGEIEIDIPQAPKGKECADIRFTYDINGILQVEITCRSTGKKDELIILNPKLSLSEKELKNKLSELEKFKLLPRDDEENKLILATASRLYEQSTGLIREQIHEHIDYFNLLLHEGNDAKIRRYRNDINEFFSQIDDELNSNDDEILQEFRDNYDDTEFYEDFPDDGDEEE